MKMKWQKWQKFNIMNLFKSIVALWFFICCYHQPMHVITLSGLIRYVFDVKIKLIIIIIIIIIIINIIYYYHS